MNKLELTQVRQLKKSYTDEISRMDFLILEQQDQLELLECEIITLKEDVMILEEARIDNGL